MAVRREIVLSELTNSALLMEIRGLPPRARKEKVMLTRMFHSREFFAKLISEARANGASPQEAEELSQLAFIVARQLPEPEYSSQAKSDLAALSCAEIASARRRSASWKTANEYIRKAIEYSDKGADCPAVKARVWSISGAIHADLGNTAKARELVESAISLAERSGDACLLGRILVKQAYILADSDLCPEALPYAARAIQVLPAWSSRLILFAESIQINCLLGLGAIDEALNHFHSLGEKFQELCTEDHLKLRIQFMSGGLLEAVGDFRRAERVYLETVSVDFERRLVKDYFLDMLYLFEAYIRRGTLADAAALCKRAMAEVEFLELDDASSAGDELRRAWQKLGDLVRRGMATVGTAAVAKEYFKRNWRVPSIPLSSLLKDQ